MWRTLSRPMEKRWLEKQTLRGKRSGENAVLFDVTSGRAGASSQNDDQRVAVSVRMQS